VVQVRFNPDLYIHTYTIPMHYAWQAGVRFFEFFSIRLAAVQASGWAEP
jgi:hypothetical protein